MILSHKYKFIFIKTRKTAGTSIEIALSRYCGTDDIITPISLEDEAMRQALGYPGPRNFWAPLSDYGLSDFRRLLYGKRKKRFRNHIPAAEVKEYVGEEIWNEYYKFCVVRNPWDRILSSYYWMIRNEISPIDLDTYIHAHRLRQKDQFYVIDDEVVVDKVCRFEKLGQELEDVRCHLGIPGPLNLPKAKSNTRRDRRSYREVLTESQKNRIAQIYKREIELFGYEF